MPDHYTHSSGYTVERDDRGVRLVITSDAGYTSTWIDNPKVDALRDFLLHDLGLWHDDETGLLVVTLRDSTDHYLVVNPSTPVLDWRCGEESDDPGRAVARYLATLTPPPREPKPGEVWLLWPDTDGGTRARVVSTPEGNLCFLWAAHGQPSVISVALVPDRRLLVEADGGEALRAVLDLHRDAGPSQGFFSGDRDYGERDHCCATCGAHGEYGVEWPCPTVQAIAKALGVKP